MIEPTLPRMLPFNYEKSLSGIETVPQRLRQFPEHLSIMKNPFQGLKRRLLPSLSKNVLHFQL